MVAGTGSSWNLTGKVRTQRGTISAPSASGAMNVTDGPTTGSGAAEVAEAGAFTVTTNEPVATSPPESVTEQATVVVPSGSTEPTAGAHVGVGSGSSSASVAEIA